ncbi:MAG: radical SAM protein [Deltaproteobacteria bacterium]|nr:radical SAM protein [Deltaproteobacteria bacterium]
MTEEPSYVLLWRCGELAARAAQLAELLTSCCLCARACGVNRAGGEVGACRAPNLATVSHAGPHFGEEPGISGNNGAGNIFFAYCSMACVFCQNYQISQNFHPEERHFLSVGQLAAVMLDLQRAGCHNINLVSPTHFLPQIVAALDLAAASGLRLPIVYNTHGYESVPVLRLLEGIVDIYLPDLKYGDDRRAGELSGAPNYVRASQAAVKVMYRQVGAMVHLNEAGLISRGLIIRHLVLPGGLAGTSEVLEFIAAHLSPKVTLSLMAQYYPTNNAADRAPLNRPVTAQEYHQALEMVAQAGLEIGWCQELSSAASFCPDFSLTRPFA